eukprot:COSAG01_NODE_65524_length_273_cov_0.586207_1_plen_58_part_10
MDNPLGILRVTKSQRVGAQLAGARARAGHVRFSFGGLGLKVPYRSGAENHRQIAFVWM